MMMATVLSYSRQSDSTPRPRRPSGEIVMNSLHIVNLRYFIFRILSFALHSVTLETIIRPKPMT